MTLLLVLYVGKLIVVFGEILPEAAFSRYALTSGARSVWLVRLFIYCLALPDRWPNIVGARQAIGKGDANNLE
ncbi:MAG: CBS domain containing-hemolysin-like protein [Parvicellaceae bacterium]